MFYSNGEGTVAPKQTSESTNASAENFANKIEKDAVAKNSSERLLADAGFLNKDSSAFVAQVQKDLAKDESLNKFFPDIQLVDSRIDNVGVQGQGYSTILENAKTGVMATVQGYTDGSAYHEIPSDSGITTGGQAPSADSPASQNALQQLLKGHK